MAVAAYARPSEGEEGWCRKRRNLARFERNQLSAPGLDLSLGLSWQMGPLRICASRKLPGLQ